jgi:hypothetical protein
MAEERYFTSDQGIVEKSKLARDYSRNQYGGRFDKAVG